MGRNLASDLRAAVHLESGDDVVLLQGNKFGFDALLILPGLRAETEVALTDANLERPLSELFNDLASNWRGWDGSKQWETYGGQLRLTAIHDGLGRVQIAVELREDGGVGWLAQVMSLSTQVNSTSRRWVRRFPGRN